MSAKTIEAQIRAKLPDGADLEFTEFASGAIDALVRRRGGEVTLLESNASGTQIGLTRRLDQSLAAFNDGHPEVFSDWEAAICALGEAIG